MKNKWKISIATALAAITTVGICANINANAEDTDVIKFSSEIVALTPRGGDMVSVVHSGMESVLNLTNPKAVDVAKYYYLRPEMETFLTTGRLPSTQEEIRACYDTCDDFAPINNVLQWSYAKEADSYTVNLALDKNFTKVVFTDTVEETSVHLGNTLYAGTDYYWQVIANDGSSQTRSEIFEFSTKAGTRTVDIDGVSNTRDEGGYQTPEGRTVQGILYRSARLDDITDEGRETVAKLGIKTDLDLRLAGEGMPNPLGINYVQALAAPNYYNGIDTESGKDSVKTIFQTLANKDNYPIVLHCSVGRDRTGTAIALMNALLGVEEQTIINEYMLSVFAYTSCWYKGDEALFNNIKGLMTYIKTFEGETLSKQTENLLLNAGVTAEEIQSVKDIMLGKTQVYDNTVESSVSYEGMHFVTVKAYGHAKETYAALGGVAIDAPYTLDENYFWTVDGVAYDFASPVTKDLTVTAQQKEYVEITVSVLGEEQIIKGAAGEEVDFTQFAKEGYTYKVMNDKGDIITSLTVTEACSITIIYFKN